MANSRDLLGTAEASQMASDSWWRFPCPYTIPPLSCICLLQHLRLAKSLCFGTPTAHAHSANSLPSWQTNQFFNV